jgi:GNAT superfamily N-acetyltransferase
MPDLFSIRRATAADAPTLARHRAGMFRDMGELPERLDGPLVDASRRYFETAIPAGEYRGWVAAPSTNQGDIVAGAGVQLRTILPRPDTRGEELILGPQALILNVYTEPAWRGRGLATLLMGEVLRWAAATGIKSLVLHASTAGRPLYEGLGFAPTTEMSYVGKTV